MATFICAKCGCIDNTASSNTIKSKRKRFKDDFANKNLLCIECTPKEYADGSINKRAGIWHNSFEKKHWSKYGTKEELLVKSNKSTGTLINAVEYFNYLQEIKDNMITKLFKEGFKSYQIQQILYGIEEGIDYTVYYDKRYDAMQMSVLREFLRKGINVTPALNPELSNDRMYRILRNIERHII